MLSFLLQNTNNMSSEEKTRFQHYSVFSSVGIIMMIIFSIISLKNDDFILFCLDLISASGLAIGWVFLRKYNCGQIVYRINSVLFSSLIIYMLIIGGEGGSKSLWIFTFPLIAFFLYGQLEGLFWTTLILLIGAGLFFQPFNIVSVYNYSFDFKIRFLATYFCIATVTYWFEYFREYYRNELQKKNSALQNEITVRQKAEEDREQLIIELTQALNEVKTLSGFLPICASCKKIRDDKGYWNQIENYLLTHTEAEFSHSICPDCVKTLYND